MDQIFIGRGVGYLGNGATNVVFPITVISLAIALMLGDDGKGYPNGLSGNDIPEVARIIAVADSFEPNRRPVGDSLPKLLTILKTASCQGGLFCLPSCC